MGFVMSWQDYVNTQLVSKGVKEGAIAGKDGNIWAKSDTFALTVDEVKVLAEKFDSSALAGLAATGFKLAGQKHFYLSTDEQLLLTCAKFLKPKLKDANSMINYAAENKYQ